MDISWIRYGDDFTKIGGGSEYGRNVVSALSKHHNIEFFNNNQRKGPIEFINSIYSLSKLEGRRDIWVRDYWSTITKRFDDTYGTNILLIYHIDSSVSRNPPLMRLAEKLFYNTLPRIDMVVTISEYWSNHFKSIGATEVRKIYFGPDIEKFKFDDDDAESFKRKYSLTDKPIVYIGNCQLAKGVVEVYNSLKKLDVHLVTSGKPHVKLPIPNLDVTHAEYLQLLNAASLVITMSKFKEGWGITPHEAMLCKTPVIGSGLGGMDELLTKGKQVICRDLNLLPSNVEAILGDDNLATRMGKDGYEYAKQFTKERFEHEWIKLIESLGK